MQYTHNMDHFNYNVNYHKKKKNVLYISSFICISIYEITYCTYGEYLAIL